MFDPIRATVAVEKPPEQSIVYGYWRVVRLVLRYDGNVEYTMQRADSDGNLAPRELAPLAVGNVEDFRQLLSNDSRLEAAALTLFSALTQHAKASGIL